MKTQKQLINLMKTKTLAKELWEEKWGNYTLQDNLEGLDYYLKLIDGSIWVVDIQSDEPEFPVDSVDEIIEFLNNSADCGDETSIEYKLATEKMY